MAESDPENPVGYGNPPAENRYRKGQSGNPSGRPRGTQNFRTEVREELAEPVNVREDGSVKTVSSQRAALKKLRAKALSGEQRALERLLEFAERYGFEDGADEDERELSRDDKLIIERFKERVICEHEAMVAAERAERTEEDEQ